MAFNIFIRQEAKLEIEEALLYYSQISIELSEDLLKQIDASKESILCNPNLFQTITKAYRKVSIDRFPYKIIIE